MVFGTVVTLTLFLLVGWAVSTEMFQQRVWRRRVESGDLDIAAALVEEAMGGWRKIRAPAGVTAPVWAGIQGAQLFGVAPGEAAVSASAEAEFKNQGGERVQVASTLEAAMAIAARLVDMLLYDVPNLRLQRARVDIYTTFAGEDGQLAQQPILTTTADRFEADDLAWESMTPGEVLGRFSTVFDIGPGGSARPIELPEFESEAPNQE